MKRSSLLIYSSLLFILFFNLWVEYSQQAKDFYGSLISPYIDEPNFSVVWTLLIVVAMVIIFRDKLDKKEQERSDLQKTLDSEMGILIIANKELNRYRLQDNLINILNMFVQKNAYVSATQWYSYIENNYQGKTKFKLNFQDGVVAEEVNLNAIQQLYYCCNSSVLREFRKVTQIYKEKSNPDPLVDFVIHAFQEINGKPEEELSQEDAVLCSLMLLASEILEKDFDLVFEDFVGSATEKFQKLIDSNRTGILRAGLMENEFYSFTHTKENEKLNRQYIARLVKIRDENLILQ